MTVITNAELVLKDSHGNIGTVKSVTDNDIAKIRNAITDIGKLVDPVSHLPIKATATTVGVVQLADDEAIAAGTTGRVVDAKQLQDAILGVTPANCVTNVAAGSTANKIKVTKDDYTTTIVIDNVEHADSANQATHAVNADEAAHAATATTSDTAKYLGSVPEIVYGVNRLNYFNIFTDTTSGAKNVANPTSDWYHHLMMNHENGSGYYFDIACAINQNAMYYRRIESGNDQGWFRLIDSGNIGSQSVNYANSAGSAGSVAWANVSGRPDIWIG